MMHKKGVGYLGGLALFGSLAAGCANALHYSFEDYYPPRNYKAELDKRHQAMILVGDSEFVFAAELDGQRDFDEIIFHSRTGSCKYMKENGEFVYKGGSCTKPSDVCSSVHSRKLARLVGRAVELSEIVEVEYKRNPFLKIIIDIIELEYPHVYAHEDSGSVEAYKERQ